MEPFEKLSPPAWLTTCITRHQQISKRSYWGRLMSREALADIDTVTRYLLQATAHGNQRAFEQLCRVYEKPLFHVTLKIVEDRELASEVTQDVLFAIWQGARNFKGDCKPFSWMWAIARHKAISALRKSLRPTPFFPLEFDTCCFRAKPELDAVICEALQKLSPEHRLVVVLTYYVNLSQHHISHILQCPVGTVKSRLSNALKHLRQVWNAPLKLETFSSSSS
jgi:RNA polymerase sigma-70 factor, ECF subfamily